MKKFSTRKIASLALVFCLFLSVFANAGIFGVTAATEATATYTYSGSLTDVKMGINGVYDANWQWVDSPDLSTVSGSQNGNTYTVTWDSEIYSQVQIWLYSDTLGTGYWPTLKPSDNGIIYSSDTAFVETDPNGSTGDDTTDDTTTDDTTTGTTATATVTYAGTAASKVWFGSKSCANADNTAWPSYTWIESGSNDYISIAANGNSWTVTWDTSEVSEVYTEIGATINGTDQKDWPTLTDGSAFVYYDAADGTLTTTKPTATASINYLGTAGNPQLIVQAYYDLDGNKTNTVNNWQTSNDDNFTFSTDGRSVTWDPTKIASIDVYIAGTIGPNYSWANAFGKTGVTGGTIDVYDNADATNFVAQEPGNSNFTASATITYNGTQGGIWTGSDGAWVIADNAWTNSWLQGPGENDYAQITHAGNVYTIKWDPTTANPNFKFGVSDEFEDTFVPELYDGAAYTLYDDVDNGKLVTELPDGTAYATVIYMGTQDVWLGVHGLIPVRTDINGYYVGDSAYPGTPGKYSACYADGDVYTFAWDAAFASQCCIYFGSNEYGGVNFNLKDGRTIYIYDKEILGCFSTEAPKMVTSTVVVDSEDSTWSGITALCTADGEWTSGLWIDGNSNDYGITVTKTVADGKTTYTYTYDMTQITTVCAQVGTTNSEGSNSNIWINLSGNTTRNVYITEDTHEVTTYPAGYTYVKPGTGEGIDGTVMVHYIREDGDYSNWYFGYWYQVDGEWLSFNKTFNAEGIYELPLNDIPASEIGFVVNYSDWASKDVEEDRFIVISKLVEGDDGLFHVYLYSGDSTVYYEPKA